MRTRGASERSNRSCQASGSRPTERANSTRSSATSRRREALAASSFSTSLRSVSVRTLQLPDTGGQVLLEVDPALQLDQLYQHRVSPDYRVRRRGLQLSRLHTPYQLSQVSLQGADLPARAAATAPGGRPAPLRGVLRIMPPAKAHRRLYGRRAWRAVPLGTGASAHLSTLLFSSERFARPGAWRGQIPLGSLPMPHSRSPSVVMRCPGPIRRPRRPDRR